MDDNKIKRMQSGSVWLGFIGIAIMVFAAGAEATTSSNFEVVKNNILNIISNPAVLTGLLFNIASICSDATKKGLFDDGTWTGLFVDLIKVGKEIFSKKGGDK